MNITYVAAVSMKTYNYIIVLPGMLIVKLRNSIPYLNNFNSDLSL